MKKHLHHLRIALANLRPYPKVSYSQCGEDLIIDFLLKGMGFNKISYLDIGAHDPISMNNTYLFYRQGGRGVCIEPNPRIYTRLKRHRRRDICLNAGVSETREDNVEFYILKSDTLSTFSKEKAECLVNYLEENIDDVIRVPILSINEVMQILPECPNLVSIDTEGMDLRIIRGIDLKKYRPNVFCVETLTYEKHKEGQKIHEIIDYMDSFGYSLYADTYINTIFLDRFVRDTEKDQAMCGDKQQVGVRYFHEEIHLTPVQDLQKLDDKNSLKSSASTALRANGEMLGSYIEESLVEKDKPLRLHLGCGDIHLPEFINFDYPKSEHSREYLRNRLTWLRG